MIHYSMSLSVLQSPRPCPEGTHCSPSPSLSPARRISSSHKGDCPSGLGDCLLLHNLILANCISAPYFRIKSHWGGGWSLCLTKDACSAAVCLVWLLLCCSHYNHAEFQLWAPLGSEVGACAGDNFENYTRVHVQARMSYTRMWGH